jgi:hypothetical protein
VPVISAPEAGQPLDGTILAFKERNQKGFGVSHRQCNHSGGRIGGLQCFREHFLTAEGAPVKSCFAGPALPAFNGAGRGR